MLVVVECVGAILLSLTILPSHFLNSVRSQSRLKPFALNSLFEIRLYIFCQESYRVAPSPTSEFDELRCELGHASWHLPARASLLFQETDVLYTV